MTNQIANRYSIGSWAETLPMTDQLDIVYGHPNRHAELLKTIDSCQSKQLEQLKSIENVSRYAIAEASFQHQESLQAISNLSENISTGLNRLENVLGGHLEGIRSVLGNIDDKIGEVLKIMLSPLGTRSAEICKGGNEALSKGFPDEAIDAFKEAINQKKTDYIAYNSLGFAFIQNGDVNSAIEAFKKAAAYIPQAADKTDRAITLENLARAYYTNYNYEDAYKYSDQARSIYPYRTEASEYRHVVYCFLNDQLTKGQVYAEALCENSPKYFLNLATDPDLDVCRDLIMKILDKLAQRSYDSAKRVKDSSMGGIKENMQVLNVDYSIYSSDFGFIEPALNEANDYLDKFTYSLSIKSKQLYEELAVVTPIVIELCKNKKEYDDLNIKDNHNKTKKEFEERVANYNTQLAKFDKKKDDDLKSLDKIGGKVIIFIYVIIGIIASYFFIGEVVDLYKESNIILFILIGILLLALVAFVYYVGAILVGGIISLIMGGAIELKKYSIKNRKLKAFVSKRFRIKI